jgi:hypothetical protein
MKLQTPLSLTAKSSLFNQLAKACLVIIAMRFIHAHSEEMTLGIHTLSYHNNGNYNDITPGIYLEKNNYVIGAYHNSIRSTSIYVGYTWSFPLPPNLVIHAVSLTGGLMEGYRQKGYIGEIPVFLAPTLRHDLDNLQSLRLTLLPLHKSSSANFVMHLSYEIKFKP